MVKSTFTTASSKTFFTIYIEEKWARVFSRLPFSEKIHKKRLQNSDPKNTRFFPDIHNDLLVKYDCKDSVSPPAFPGGRAHPGHDSQDGVSQQKEDAPLLLP